MSTVPPPLASASTSAHRHRRNFADPCQRVGHDPDDCRIAVALEAAAAVRGERGVRFGVRPADAGDLAAAPVPTFPPDAAQHVFAETVRRGIAEARHLVHLGDSGPLPATLTFGCDNRPGRRCEPGAVGETTSEVEETRDEHTWERPSKSSGPSC